MVGIAIGELSARTQVKIPTIRYYEQIGLLGAPTRTEGKARRYEEDDVERLDFIRNARELGLEVDAIRELMDLERRPSHFGVDKDVVGRRHLQAVQGRIDRLLRLREALELVIEQPAEEGQSEARVIKALAGWP